MGFCDCCFFRTPAIAAAVVASSNGRRMRAVATDEAAAIQASLSTVTERIPHGMTIEDRKDLVCSVLLTRHVVAVKETPKGLSSMEKGDLVVSAIPRVEKGQDITEGITCTICMNEYVDGDEICWSHNKRCSDVFHRHCIVQWLIKHEDCPNCRHNFLSLGDDGDDEVSSNPAVIDDDDVVRTSNRHSYMSNAVWGALQNLNEPLSEEALPDILSRTQTLDTEEDEEFDLSSHSDEQSQRTRTSHVDDGAVEGS